MTILSLVMVFGYGPLLEIREDGARTITKGDAISADMENGREMSTAISPFGEAVWNLPPLILHPFNEQIAPASLLESSKAALMLSGLIPSEGAEPEDLKRHDVCRRSAEDDPRDRSR